MKGKYTVFCDFDGTITNWETAEQLWKKMLGDMFHLKMEELIARQANTSVGIKELYGMIPSARYPEFDEYVKSIEIRPGFGEFLRFLKKRNIPLIVVSSGIQEMLQFALAPYLPMIKAHYCAYLDTSDKYIRVYSDYDDGVDLLRKELVMAKHPSEKTIYLGDSYSDQNAAQKADIVFARDNLAAFFDKEKLSYYPFETFFEVMEQFRKQNLTNIV